MEEILDGKKLASEIKNNLAKKIEKKELNPGLAAILIGDDPSSKKYLELKDKDCREVGINFKNFKLPEDSSISEVKKLISNLNEDKDFDGIIVQLPAPDPLDRHEIINSINHQKDVDGLNPLNVGKLWTGNYDFEEDLLPCTPKGVIRLLEKHDIEFEGSDAAIVNRSNLVGNPLAKLLIDRNSTVTICHSKTENLKKKTRKAEILITAVGNRESFEVREEMVKEDAVVVDVGMNYVDGELKGDVNFDDVKEKCSYITPVPGGVGPMTRVILLENVVLASEPK